MKKSVPRRESGATFLFLFWSLVVSSGERIYKSDSILIRPLMTLRGMRDECGEEADICEV